MNFLEPLPYLTTLSVYQVTLSRHWPGYAFDARQVILPARRTVDQECVTASPTTPANPNDLVSISGDPYHTPTPDKPSCLCAAQSTRSIALTVQLCCPSDSSSIWPDDSPDLAKVSCQFRVSALSQCSLCSGPLQARLHLLIAMNFREPLPYLTTLSVYQASLTKHWPGHATTPAKPSCLRAAQSTGSVSPCCSNLPSLRQLPQTLTTLSAYQVILTTPLYPPSHPACAPRSRPGV